MFSRVGCLGLLALVASGLCGAQESIVWDSAGAFALPGGSQGGYFYDYAPGSVAVDGVDNIFYCSNRDSGVVVDHIALTRIDHDDGTVIAGRELVLAPGVPESEQWRHVAGVWNRATGQIALFVDGIQVAESVHTGMPALKAFGGFRVIGGSLDPAARNTFHGKIDEVRVSKSVRDVAQAGWQSPYTADSDTVDLYHFDLATDPSDNVRFFDSATPQQNGYYFDFANPGSDLHAASTAGFGECPRFGNSSGTGSRGELFPDSPSHDVINDTITVEAWIRPDELTGTQTIFDSLSAQIELVDHSISFNVFFTDATSLSVSADGGWSTEIAWDAYHVCDPSVVRGAFLLDGETYGWAMFYLGVDVPDVTHNQVGVAFAHELAGPWVKWDGNPVAPFESYSYWGVGQPSATSIDGAGHVLLFYTRGDPATRIVRRELDLSDLSAPVIGPEVTVPTNGLTSRDGSPVVFHNADFAYDPARDAFFVTRTRHPFDSALPSFVASELQIAYIPAEAIWSGAGSWHVLGHVNSSHTGKARNHDSGLLRNPYGGLADDDQLTVLFCGSDEGNDWLWTYRLWSITGDLVGFDLTPPVISLNGPNVLTIGLGEPFADPVTAWDDVDGDITANLAITGPDVNTAVESTYIRIYNVFDSAGNAAAEVTLTVVVTDDIDDDALSDRWERTYFGSLDQGPRDDPDGDGIDNIREQAHGTDPTDPESRMPAVSWPALLVLGLALAASGVAATRRPVGP